METVASKIDRCSSCTNQTEVYETPVPFINISILRCADCIRSGSYPLDLLVWNTALSGGILVNMSDDWQLMVHRTLDHTKIKPETFDEKVSEALDSLIEYNT